MFRAVAKTMAMARERIVSGQSGGEEENQFNYALRPKNFSQYIGQETLIRRLKIAVDAPIPSARVRLATMGKLGV